MRARPLLLAISLAFAAIGCSDRTEDDRPAEEASAKGAAAPEQDKMKQVWERMITIMEGLADIAEANQDDCVKMALELDKVLEANLKFLKKAKRIRKANAQDVELQEAYQPRLLAAMAKIVPAMKACKDNPDLERTMQKLDPQEDAPDRE